MADPKKKDEERTIWRYPLTKLDESDDYVKITILEYKAPGFIPEGKKNFALPTAGDPNTYRDKKDIKATIILPIPNSVVDSGNTAQWGANPLNPIQSAIAGGAFSLFGTQDFKSLRDNVEAGVDKILGAMQASSTQRGVESIISSYAMNLIGGNYQSFDNTLSRSSGFIANSNIELIFNGVNLRQPFIFAFDIVPRSEKESKEVKDIIRMFKQYSSPQHGKSDQNAAGLFLQAPKVFKLEYMNGKNPHPFLHKFKICALNGMNVNYTPNATYATYTDATPVNIQLGLSFQELTPIYAEDYNNEKGVGY